MESQDNKNTTFTYVFKHNIRTVWNILKDFKISNRYCELAYEGFCNNIVFFKRSETYEKGAHFEMLLKKVVTLNMENKEVIEKDNFARILWEVNTNSNIPIYDYVYNLYSDMSGTCCTMVMEMNFKKELKQSKEEKEEQRKEFLLIFKNIDTCLENEKITKSQVEEIKIDQDFEYIWNYLLHFKELRNLVTLICDKVEYDADSLNEGMIVTMKWVNLPKSEVKLLVKSTFKEFNYAQLIFESVQSNPPIPKQKIEWRLEQIEIDKCLLKITHSYNEVIKKKCLDYTSKIKKKILSNLKRRLEDL